MLLLRVTRFPKQQGSRELSTICKPSTCAEKRVMQKRDRSFVVGEDVVSQREQDKDCSLPLIVKARCGGEQEPAKKNGPIVGVSMQKPVIKFPQTPHIYNLGCATRDDLLVNQTQLCNLLSGRDPSVRIIVQEKVDGANMGITLDKQTWAFCVQNRSHYVTSKSHKQFRKLDLWLHKHEEELWNALTCNEMLQPGRLLLYGEWVAAKHSIHYTALPDYFIAYDMYDTVQGRFYSSVRLKEALKPTSLSMIHEIQVDGRVLSKDVLERLVGTKSCYYDGIVEGVYVRAETDMWTVDRAKVVRPDFVCGNDQWSKGQMTWNVVRERVTDNVIHDEDDGHKIY